MGIHKIQKYKAIYSEMFSIGSSAMMMQILFAVQQTFLFKQAFAYGGDDWGILMSATMRLYMFSFIPLWGMSQGLQPVIGANFGAKQYGRVKDTMKIFMYGATILAAASWIPSMFCLSLIHIFIDSKNRLQELERLMCRIYEDMILEKIPNNRYEILNNQYETEQRELSKEIDELEKAIKRYEKETDRAKKFIRLIERYDNFDELTPTIINEFVEKILVHERDRKGSQTANQKVEIYFNFIGNYEPPKEELSEEEMQKLREDEEKERARKDRLHQNYLKRKANGKQKEYEDRYKARREEKKQEKLKSLKRTGIPVSEYRKIFKKQK